MGTGRYPGFRKIPAYVSRVFLWSFILGNKTAMESDFFNSIFGIQAELPLDRVYYRGFSIDSARVLPYESSDHKPIAVRLTRN